MNRRPGGEGGPHSPGDPADDFVPEEKSRRPKDTPFRQQRVKSFLPILQPVLVVGIFLAIGVVFIPLGKWFIDESKSIVSCGDLKSTTPHRRGQGTEIQVVEYVERYDEGIVGCNITEADEGGNCTIEIEVDKFMSAPIYIYYELDNYYQNHRRYVKSRSSLQLLGKTVEPDELCDPLLQGTVNGVELNLNPCGLIANSMFNDIIRLTNKNITMEETGISWESDREERFKQPPGFVYAKNGTDDCCSCETCLGGDEYSSCEIYEDYYYWYPDNDETHFLYEIYPDIVSPIEGVLNEHFIVWMRTAGLPKFRKVYGRIEQDLSPDDVLTFNITSNFYVSDFSGKKSLVVSNLSCMGARNPYLGISYIALGSLSLAVGVAFAIKHISAPRKLGDTKFLVWKDTAL